MYFNLAEFLYEERSLGVFLLVTVVLGGGGSWLTGRALAMTWRPMWQVVCYTLLLAAAIRFMHFALFGGTLLSLHYYLVDSTLCLIIGLLAFYRTRARQIVTQYGWLRVPHPRH